LVLIASVAFAQAPTRSADAEKRIEQQLQDIAPDAVPAFHQATIAMDANDYAGAARLYREVLSQAPAFSPALRRLGSSLAAAGQVDEGLKFAEEAVRRERSPENLFSLATMLVTPVPGTPPPRMTLERALALAKEARTRAGAGADASYLSAVAQLALAAQQYGDFREASRELNDRFPGEMAAHYFGAIRAALDEDWARAVREIREAEKLGLPHQNAARFLDSGVGLRANIRRGLDYGALALLVWIASLLTLFVAGKMLSAATLRSIEVADPNDGPTPREVTLRRLYRGLINIAGTFYYVSLPVVMLLVVGGTAGVIYGFFVLGTIPIRLVAFLGVGALVTTYKMVQSLFIRVPSNDPGRSLPDSEAPGLWRLTRDIATAVGTRPIDEIRVTPGTELAVYERGGRRQRTEDRGRRTLVLGLGLLDGFGQAPFCAVLAHEYGHFAHRDTAGGDIALRVQQDMLKFAMAMVQHGQAVSWNLAFQFLRLYVFLFRRISHGATRLQEVLADRIAARQYGAKQFEDGLRHVVRRQIQFAFIANSEIKLAIEGGRALQNLYDQKARTTPGIEQEIAQALARPTTEDDTHPGPLDRFRLLHGLTAKREPVESGMVWDLFDNRDALTREMTAAVDSQVKAAAEAMPTT
jgi:Zn-dependent protease with chaperone function